MVNASADILHISQWPDQALVLRLFQFNVPLLYPNPKWASMTTSRNQVKPFRANSGPTIFDLIYMILISGGAISGARAGFERFGYAGGAIACVLGAGLGALVGEILMRLQHRSMDRRVRRQTTPALRAELTREYISGTFVSSLIISVLLERGEPAESFRDYIFRQLHSDYVTSRRAGLYSLRICFPDLADKLEGFNAFEPTEDDLDRLNEIGPKPGAT